jgi:DNA-binding transcriptional ArsR family regulator
MPRSPEEGSLAAVAGLVADAARARMLVALLDGRAQSATELALAAEVAPSTASAHLARLLEGGVLAVERQGRHRYYRLAGAAAAALLEGLGGFAALRGAETPRRFGTQDPALRRARLCYDHRAGERGVRLFEELRAAGLLAGDDGCALTAEGEERLAAFGVDFARLRRSRRTFARPCLDWTERRSHLGGALGAELFARLDERGGIERTFGSRAVVVTPAGERMLRSLCETSRRASLRALAR